MTNLLQKFGQWKATLSDLIKPSLVSGIDASGNLVAFKVNSSGSLSSGNPNAVAYLTGTAPQTGTFTAIDILTDTVFTTLTGMNGSSISGVTFTAGRIIYGPFTTITLASGSVLVYS